MADGIKGSVLLVRSAFNPTGGLSKRVTGMMEAALAKGEQWSSNHSAKAETLGQVVMALEATKKPYRLVAVPGLGYSVQELRMEDAMNPGQPGFMTVFTKEMAQNLAALIEAAVLLGHQTTVPVTPEVKGLGEALHAYAKEG